MKKLLLTFAAVLLVTGIGWAQGTMDFESVNLPTSYSDGNFTEDGVTYTYGHSRDQEKFPIDGQGLMLRRASDSYFEWTVPDGLGELTFQYRKAYTGAPARQLEVYVNDEVLATTDEFGSGSGEQDDIYTFSKEINKTGSVTIKIKNVGSATGNKQSVIDKIEWSGYAIDDPYFITSANSLNDFEYMETEGPSTSQSFTLTAENIDPNIANVDITVSDGAVWEISFDETTWSDALEITDYNGTGTPVYARLKAGLNAGVYDEASISITDRAAELEMVSVSLEGEVIESFALPYENKLRNQTDLDEVLGYGFLTTSTKNTQSSGGGWLSLAADEYLRSPVMDVDGLDFLSIQFSSATFGSGDKGNFIVTVSISTDGGATFEDSKDYIIETGSTTYTVNTLNTVFDVTGAENVMVQFQSTDSGELRFRDIKLEEGLLFTVNGSQGWRMLASPTTNKYQELLSGIWTQGISNSKFPGAGEEVMPDANVFDFDFSAEEVKDDDFAALSNLNTAMTPGKGFIAYVFESDNFVAETDFPKHLYGTTARLANSAPYSVALNTKNEGWTLAGNPFNAPIYWDNIDKAGLMETVYYYDGDDTKGYLKYNGIVEEDLPNGEIGAFSGFWVQNDADTEERSLSIGDGAKTEPVSGAKVVTQSGSFKLSAEIDGMSANTYFSFTGDGALSKDNRDALKLDPLDYHSHLSMGTVVDGQTMSINNLPFGFEGEAEYALSINALKVSENGYALQSGEVTLKAEDFKNIPENWDVFVNNYNTGERVNLREVEEYAFMLSPKQKMIAPSAPMSMLTPLSPTPVRSKVVEESGISISIIGSDTPTATEVDETPAIFALEQNYPNPFNPTTTIKYSVANAGQVNLTVYNIMGQKVAELVNATQTAGMHTAQWDAKNAASGLYFYKLSSAGQTLTKQMMLIK